MTLTTGDCHGEARFLAFQIGCIECGEPSCVLGVFGTKAEAEAACEKARREHEANWRGQRYFEVYDLTGVSDE